MNDDRLTVLGILYETLCAILLSLWLIALLIKNKR